jgi:hypothetical protein
VCENCNNERMTDPMYARREVLGIGASHVIPYSQRVGHGWQMRSGATMPDAAGGEGVTGWLNRKG